jgi:hypothetical protein
MEVHEVRLYRREAMVTALTDAGFSVSLRRSYGPAKLPPGALVCVALRMETAAS